MMMINGQRLSRDRSSDGIVIFGLMLIG